MDWNTKDKAGDTPLICCLKEGNLDKARVLLQNSRVDIHTANKEGTFPETIAREKDQREILDRMSKCPVCVHKYSRTSQVFQEDSPGASLQHCEEHNGGPESSVCLSLSVQDGTGDQNLTAAKRHALLIRSWQDD